MNLYDRILEEAHREGIEYQLPRFQSGREPTGELRVLRSLVYNGPTNLWSAMAYASLKRKYPAAYERFLLEKNGGDWMFGFRGEKRRGKSTLA
ncbi:MAG: hypothetical protein M3305_12750 [Actinomycetota bacterium]|nr:hypothetical protein [Actinomycetota bacterium]